MLGLFLFWGGRGGVGWSLSLFIPPSILNKKENTILKCKYHGTGVKCSPVQIVAKCCGSVQNVAKCCWSVLISAKLKWGSWSRSLAGPWLAKHYLPYKICIFSCSTFSHYLFTDSPCPAPQTQATFQRYILMFLSRFGFSMIKIKRPKLNHRNEKKRWIWARQLKSIAVGVWVQGWPLLTEI